MVTLVWRTDLHLADQAPQSRTDNWADTILDKVAQIGDIAREEKADGVLDGGDFFNIKSPIRNSHQLVSRAVKAHQNYPCPVWATIGNHDCKYGSSEFLGEGPLGVLFETGIFRRLYGEHEALFDTPDVRVRVVGIPYHGTQYDLERFGSIKKGDEDFLVVVAHVLASQKGGNMFEGEDVVKYADLAKLDPDCWMMGHWHKDQGITEIADGKWVINVGSISRGALSQDDIYRNPKCVVAKFDKKGTTFIERPLKVAPAVKVFDMTGRDRREARADNLDVFVEHLGESLKSLNDEVSIEDQVRNLSDLDSGVKERVLSYLEQARKK